MRPHEDVRRVEVAVRDGRRKVCRRKTFIVFPSSTLA